jgi:hypothetical protein
VVPTHVQVRDVVVVADGPVGGGVAGASALGDVLGDVAGQRGVGDVAVVVLELGGGRGGDRP